MRNRNTTWAILILAAAVALAFAAITQHVWEDFYITYRTSRNLVAGHGMVFQVGEKVHTFTSPLGTLLPAVTRWVSGSDAGALFGYQVLGALAFGGAVVWLWLLGRRAWQLPLGFSILAPLLLVCDAKAVDFSVNGMETGFMLLFLAGFVAALQLRSIRDNWVALGVCAAGLQWTRPDAFILGFGVVAGFWLFAPETLDPTVGRWRLLVPLLKALALAGLLYLPWLAWAGWYYGSPIPNTILAKSQPFHGWRLRTSHDRMQMPWLRGLGAALLPIYSILGGWPSWCLQIGYVAARVIGHWWLVPWANPRGRACSFGAFVFGVYLSTVTVYPWYLPPASLLCIVVVVFMLADVQRWLQRWKLPAPWLLPAAGATCLLGLQLALFGATAREVYWQERVIESQRRTIGLDLRQRAAPNDRVFLECAGYIGFYSELKLLDYPGLTAPEVVRARREIADDWGVLVRHFRPEWVVLRPAEVAKVNSPRYPDFSRDYQMVRTFSHQETLDRLSDFPGKPYLRYDETFIVFRRN